MGTRNDHQRSPQPRKTRPLPRGRAPTLRVQSPQVPSPHHPVRGTGSTCLPWEFRLGRCAAPWLHFPDGEWGGARGRRRVEGACRSLVPRGEEKMAKRIPRHCAAASHPRALDSLTGANRRRGRGPPPAPACLAGRVPHPRTTGRDPGNRREPAQAGKGLGRTGWRRARARNAIPGEKVGGRVEDTGGGRFPTPGMLEPGRLGEGAGPLVPPDPPPHTPQPLGRVETISFHSWPLGLPPHESL